mgnify:CR=1 FL=1
MKEVYIVDGIRTAIGKLGGSLSSIRADDLAAITIRELLNRNPSVNKEKIREDFIITKNDLIAEKYVLLQRGKKSYFLIRFE